MLYFFLPAAIQRSPPKLELLYLVTEIKREFAVDEQLQYDEIKNSNVKLVVV